MAYTFRSRPTQVPTQPRFPVTEFEPLLDSSKPPLFFAFIQRRFRRWPAAEDPRAPRRQGLAFRVSDLNDWLWRQERAMSGASAD